MKLPDTKGAALAMLWALHKAGIPAQLAHKLVFRSSIGRGFRLGRGACVIGRQVTIGAGVSIGAGASITADSIELGDGVQIGSGVTIRCRRLVLGARARIDAETTVYGMATPNSGLVMGESSWVFSHCHINTDELVQIGARTAAGSHTLIFSHSSYLPVTNGYPVTFAPVSIGEEVWLPWHVFILPGTRIGDGATVGAMSLVGGTIPPRSLAVGVPAKVIKDEGSYLRQYDVPQLETVGLRVVEEVIRNFVGAFKPRHLFFPSDIKVEVLSPAKWRLNSSNDSLVVAWNGGAPSRPPAHDSELTLTVGLDHPPEGATLWADLRSLHARLPERRTGLLYSFLSHFSSHGIRFGWRHAVTPIVAPGHDD